MFLLYIFNGDDSVHRLFGLGIISEVTGKNLSLSYRRCVRCALKTVNRNITLFKCLGTNPEWLPSLLNGSYLFVSFAGSTRLEIRSASSGPHLPVALSGSLSDGLRPDFYPRFEDVAT